MLKFIEESDFLKVDSFKENQTGFVSWVWDEGEGLPTHSGVIHENYIVSYQYQDGTENVQVGVEKVQVGVETIIVGTEPVLNEETGETVIQDITQDFPIYVEEPIFEEQPRMVDAEVNVWEKLWELHHDPDSPITVESFDVSYYVEQAKQQINSIRDAHITSGVEFEGHTYQTKSTNVTDMLEAAVANRDTQWLTADNTVVNMPVTKLNELIQVVANKKELYIYKARQHKDNVLNLTTKEDIDDYMSNLTW